MAFDVHPVYLGFSSLKQSELYKIPNPMLGAP